MLIYDNLPPAALQLRPWYTDRHRLHPTPNARTTALHLVSTPASARLDRRVDATDVPKEVNERTRVRLEQFRITGELDVPRRTRAMRPILRRAAAAGILASALAAIAVAYGTLSSPERSDRPTPTRHAAAVLAVDSEHAAATREVAPADSGVRSSRQPKSGKRHQTENKRRSVTSSQNRSAPRAQHAPTASVSHEPATNTTTTVVRTAAPTTRRQTPVASATSESGFEG